MQEKLSKAIFGVDDLNVRRNRIVWRALQSCFTKTENNETAQTVVDVECMYYVCGSVQSFISVVIEQRS